MYHAVGEEVPTQDAEVIGGTWTSRLCRSPPKTRSSTSGWMGVFWAINAPTSNDLTRERLGWQPTGPELIPDLEAGHYFRTS